MQCQTPSENAPQIEQQMNLHGLSRQVRNVIEEMGPLPLANVARRIRDATTNEVAMAVGWLAHADEIRFRRHEEMWVIELKEHGSVG